VQQCLEAALNATIKYRAAVDRASLIDDCFGGYLVLIDLRTAAAHVREDAHASLCNDVAESGIAVDTHRRIRRLRMVEILWRPSGLRPSWDSLTVKRLPSHDKTPDGTDESKGFSAGQDISDAGAHG
jgi:hypothetical protein